MAGRFIGRQKELKQLLHMSKKQKASFIVVKGRRRVGKSRLIDEFSKTFEQYYKFEGLAPEPDVTPRDQLEEFCRQLSRQFKAPLAKYDDWSDAFWAVGERVQTGKILLFFDEISWMSDGSTTFLAKIKSFWDNLLTNNQQLVFIVCSSASGWIEKNLLSSMAFVGRVSLTVTLEELTLLECNAFWQKNIAAYEKLKVLSVTGGIPRYLEEIDPTQSAEENIKQLCFTKGALLVNEFKRIFSDLFLRESPFYESIVNALSTGPKEQIEIKKALQKKHGHEKYGRISEYLWELEEAGFIRREYTWDINTGEESKFSKYRLQDNYLRFYLKYLKKNINKIKRDAFSLQSLTALPQWNGMMGFQFENLVLNNRPLIQEALSIQPQDIVNDNAFFQRKNVRIPGCQIDYMIQTRFNSLYVCEIKFSKHKIGMNVIDEVQSKLDKLIFPRGFSCRPVLIHVNGVTSDVEDSGYFSNIIDMSDFMG